MLEQYLVPCTKKAIYMAVTDDRFELPLAVGDSCRDLARFVGVDPGVICRQVNGAVKGAYKKGRKFVKVYVDAGEEKDGDAAWEK